MAWATTIGPAMAQIDYRLQENAGCGRSLNAEGQVEYRLDSDRPLEWLGDGVREVGFEPGQALDDDAKKAARMLADGRDPRTGEVLVAPKMAVDPRAKLDAAPLVDAVRAAAERAGKTPAQLFDTARSAARFGRLQRGVAQQRARAEGAGADVEGLTHRAPVGDLETVANAAGVRLDDLYDGAELATARQYKNARVPVGNRGYDVTVNVPKSWSVLVAMADPQLAGELEDAYLDVVREAVSALQGWAGYAMRGHHGDGQRAERVEGTGLLGWMTVHRTARPVTGQAPDPHLHAHLTFLNLVKGVDGKWSTIGAGGRDVHRHVKAVGTFVQARLRHVTRERWGIEWARDDLNGEWEIVSVPAELRTVFSKRHGQVTDALSRAGVDPGNATAAQQRLAAQRSKQDKAATRAGVDLRAEWHRQAREKDVDPADLVAATMGGPGRPAPEPTPVAAIAEQVFAAPETGLTAHRKVATKADVLAAVMDVDPAGIASLAEAKQLVDAVLAEPVAVALPAVGATHLSNAARYTSADVVDAERTVLQAARDRYNTRLAVVDDATVNLAVAQFETANGFTLSTEQRAVLDRLTTAGHGVDTVIGVAGSGKTTIMAAMRAAYEAQGMTVAGAATAAVAAANLQTEAGITSRTIASWLTRITGGPGLAGVDVLVIDEAAMADDRQMAALLSEAGRTSTKIVAIGDPLQLRAVGIGGTFAAVHEMIGGLELAENRRQRDQSERQALAVWRTGQRRTAVQAWAGSGRVNVTSTPEQAHEAMLAAWTAARAGYVDGHDAIEGLLLLAHTNADVTALNTAVQAARHEAGLLGVSGRYALRAGGQLTVHVGDTVMTRRNDSRLGVLNGERGIVTAIDGQTGRVTVERRHAGPDGPELVRVDLPRGYAHDGHLQLAYAITAAKAQGLTADRALVYGNGMDAHTLYPAMSRDRARVDLWLALDPLETDADRARHGAPASDVEARQRAVDAYAAAVANDRPDSIVLTELGEAPDPIAVRPAGEPEAAPDPGPAPRREPVADVDALTARVEQLPDAALRQPSEREVLRERLQLIRLDAASRQAVDEQIRRNVMAELRAIAAGEPASGRFTREQLQEGLTVARAEMLRAQREAAAAAGGRAEHVPAGANPAHVPWQQRPHGNVPTEQLPDAIARAEQAAERAAAAAAARERAEQARLATARAGQGPAMRELEQQRAQLQAAVDAARQAEQQLQAARTHEAKARQARALLRTVQDAEASRGRLAKMFRPRTDDVARQVQQLRDVAVRADHDAGEARAAAWPHEQLARQTPNAAARLADLQRTWTDRAAAAMHADEQPPVTAATLAARAFPRQHQTPEALQQRAAGLRAEAALRERLDPGLARAEEVSRAAENTRQAIARMAETREAARESARQPSHDYYRDHHRDVDHGPDIGL